MANDNEYSDKYDSWPVTIWCLFFQPFAFLCLNTEFHTYQFRHTNESG